MKKNFPGYQLYNRTGKQSVQIERNIKGFTRILFWEEMDFIQNGVWKKKLEDLQTWWRKHIFLLSIKKK